MNVCAFFGGKTTEHESFSAQRNARQGENIEKKKVSVIFWTFGKMFFEILINLLVDSGLFGVVQSSFT